MELYSVIRYLIVILSLAVLVPTLLPLSGSHAWWIRGWDFPRAQIAVFGVVILVLVLIFMGGFERILVGGLLTLCIGYQAYRIYPYTPIASTEITLADSSECSEIVTLMSVNVLMENENHQELMREVEKVDPDVLLLMEMDQTWVDAVEPLLSRYETVIRVPLDNHYGLAFATRLKANKAEAVYLVDDETPSVFAELETSSGQTLRYVGLHPRPPVPGNNTEERDAQILFTARFARDSDVPLVAMGDFNDAAWSDTAQLFKTVGEYLDPRVGRGFYASFDARSKLLRSPIDHFYHTRDVAVVDFGRGSFFGSDHFPISAKICLDQELARRLNSVPPPLTDDERQRADEIVAARMPALGGLFD